jgi:hypothetical protein
MPLRKERFLFILALSKNTSSVQVSRTLFLAVFESREPKKVFQTPKTVN